ncbi:unnamed protein product [Adineta steineri]|uniref:Retrotransposon gag domain-containing protein n=1 Tax=Adineta steineri TaxID=433720 RepID=A0A815DMK5_9BILA|nr:unnamed protein product [Adineta steineri]
MSKDFASYFKETTSKLKDNKREWNYMNINMKWSMDKLNHISNSAVILPTRSARQEQEWYECRQGEEESIHEFIIRLRTLWVE